MVRGLDVFRKHFTGFEDRFVLIGGVACDLAMEQAGLEFRATKDFDIVLCIEALDAEFVNRFWDFIEAGGYQQREKSDGKQEYYRFIKPAESTYPEMLELFSRTPLEFDIPESSHLTPIPVDQEIDSLSAILLDTDYYECIQQGRQMIDGIPVLGVEYILPFKAKAWLENTKRKQEGGKVDSRDIRKHRNDVFRLFPLLVPGQRVEISEAIRQDMSQFIEAMPNEDGLIITDLGIRNAPLEAVLSTLSSIYGLG